MAMFFSFCCFEGLILVPLLYFPLDFVFQKMFFDVFCHFADIIFAWIFIHTQWVIPYYVFSSFKKHLLQLYQQYLSHDLCISPGFASILNVQNPNQKRTFSACIFRFERFAILHLSLLNESERYYDHKKLWVIVKNFSVNYSPPPKQRNYIKRSTSIVQHKHFEILERYFNTSNLRI